MYKRMCIDIKQEQDNYMNEQKRKVLESGVLNILDEKIEKMVQEYCKIEQARLSQYPVSTKKKKSSACLTFPRIAIL